MITVKLYGLLRIESGIKELHLQARTMTDVFRALAEKGLSPKELNACLVLINGTGATRRSKLTDGDTVILMSPVAGG